MSSLLLSAALIVRNEERRLAGCLRSLQGVADEVVVVDTGSSDRSAAIARSFGARVLEFAWRDDFAAARNAALDRCRGTWILYIDADERVRPCSRTELERVLRKWFRAGWYVDLRPKVGYTPYREMRLFRNHPLIRFEGVIHENIWPGLRRYIDRHGGLIGQSPLVLDHLGYEGEQGHKHERNLPLLLEAIEHDPDRVYYWYDLGRAYRGLGRTAEAREAWSGGIARSRAKKRRDAEDSLPYVELLRFDFAEGRDISALLDEARARFPDHAFLTWLAGQVCLREGRLTEAMAHFQWLIRCGEARRFDPDLSHDCRMFTAWPLAAMATCLFQQRRYADSARYFSQAEACEPEQLEYRVKRQLCERLTSAA